MLPTTRPTQYTLKHKPPAASSQEVEVAKHKANWQDKPLVHGWEVKKQNPATKDQDLNQQFTVQTFLYRKPIKPTATNGWEVKEPNPASVPVTRVRVQSHCLFQQNSNLCLTGQESNDPASKSQDFRQQWPLSTFPTKNLIKLLLLQAGVKVSQSCFKESWPKATKIPDSNL